MVVIFSHAQFGWPPPLEAPFSVQSWRWLGGAWWSTRDRGCHVPAPFPFFLGFFSTCFSISCFFCVFFILGGSFCEEDSGDRFSSSTFGRHALSVRSQWICKSDGVPPLFVVLQRPIHHLLFWLSLWSSFGCGVVGVPLWKWKGGVCLLHSLAAETAL